MTPFPLHRIVIDIIPHTAQRYPTVGDYFQESPGVWVFKISDVGQSEYALLVAIHELVEWWWAQRAGVPNEAIDAFDMAYEAARAHGEHGQDEEPGDDPSCPVYAGHQLASGIERMCAAMFGISWENYEGTLAALDHPMDKPEKS